MYVQMNCDCKKKAQKVVSKSFFFICPMNSLSSWLHGTPKGSREQGGDFGHNLTDLLTWFQLGLFL